MKSKEKSVVQVKICGLKEPANIDQVYECRPDFLGMVLYPKSPRYAADSILPVQLQNIPNDTGKVGVFVNAEPREIANSIQTYFFSHVQLHGDESPEFIRVLQKNLPGINVIKAFQVDADFDFSVVAPYASLVSHVLFDTASEGYGGSGKSFNWDILSSYKHGPQFFLSGGLDCDNVAEAITVVLEHPLGFGLDASSGLEISPGVKSISLVRKFLEKVRDESRSEH